MFAPYRDTHTIPVLERQPRSGAAESAGLAERRAPRPADSRLVRWIADLTCYWCSATISDIRLDGPSARQVFPTEVQRRSIKPHLGQPRCAHCRGPFYMENIHVIYTEDPAILRIPARRGRPPKRPRVEAE